MIFTRPKLMLKFEVRKKIKKVTKEALEKAKEKEALRVKLAETAIDLVQGGTSIGCEEIRVDSG